MLDVLVPRLGDDNGEKQQDSKDVSKMNLQQLIDFYEDQSGRGAVDALLVELEARLINYVICPIDDRPFFSQKPAAMDYKMDNVTMLQKILNTIIDGDHYEYAMNELRGILFDQLLNEHITVFNKRRAEYTDKDWKEDAIKPGMRAFLIEVCKQAHILVNVLKENPGEIPKVLIGVVDAAKSAKNASIEIRSTYLK